MNLKQAHQHSKQMGIHLAGVNKEYMPPHCPSILPTTLQPHGPCTCCSSFLEHSFPEEHRSLTGLSQVFAQCSLSRGACLMWSSSTSQLYFHLLLCVCVHVLPIPVH